MHKKKLVITYRVCNFVLHFLYEDIVTQFFFMNRHLCGKMCTQIQIKIKSKEIFYVQQILITCENLRKI